MRERRLVTGVLATGSVATARERRVLLAFGVMPDRVSGDRCRPVVILDVQVVTDLVVSDRHGFLTLLHPQVACDGGSGHLDGAGSVRVEVVPDARVACRVPAARRDVYLASVISAEVMSDRGAHVVQRGVRLHTDVMCDDNRAVDCAGVPAGHLDVVVCAWRKRTAGALDVAVAAHRGP